MNTAPLRLFAKRLIAPFNFAVVSKTGVLAANPDWEIRITPSLILARLVAETLKPTIVQIGAYDGGSNDYVSQFIIQGFVGRALLVEPQTGPFTELRQRYAPYPNVELENCVVTAKAEAAAEFYSVKPEFHHLDPNCGQYAGLTPEVIVKQMSGRVSDVQRIIQRVSVASKTLPQLLQEHKIAQVDFLAVDTEGYDAEILGSVDWNAFRPSSVCFEIRHLNTTTRAGLYSEFHRFGYRLHECFPDCVAVRNDVAKRWENSL